MNSQQYYLAIRFKNFDKKQVVPFNWCMNLNDVKHVVYHKPYKIRFSGRFEDGYILNYFSKYFYLIFYSDNTKISNQ